MNFRLNFGEIAARIVILIGIILSLVQFICNRSLWLDESMLAHNIIHKTGIELLRPLDVNQVAPILFLEIEKLFSVLLPDSEYGLRLFPLLSFWAALFFFYGILKKVFNDYHITLIGLALFAFNILIINYSNEVKQYIVDVMVIFGIYYFLLKDYKHHENRYLVLGIAGALAICLSNVSPIVLFSAGLYLIYEWLFQNKKNFKNILAVSVVWAVCFGLYYFLFIYNHPSRAFMKAFWADSDAFMPAKIFSHSGYYFLQQKFAMIFNSLTEYGITVKNGLIALSLAGIISLIAEKKAGILILVLSPVILHLILSSFELYPFDKRLILYLFPLIILTIAAGIGYLIPLIPDKFIYVRYAVSVFLVSAILFRVIHDRKLPIRNEEIKESISYIRSHYKKGESIYIYYGAVWAFNYYQDIGLVRIPAPVIRGTMNRGNSEKYLDELKKLKGKNWLLFSHDQRGERDYITDGLDSLGCTQKLEFTTDDSSAYLYDFDTSKPDKDQ